MEGLCEGLDLTNCRTQPWDAVVYVADRDGLGPIFASAYLTPARILHSLGVASGVVALTTPGTSIKPTLREKWKAKVREWRPRLSWFLSYPALPKSSNLTWTDRLALAHAVSRIKRQFQPRRLILATGSAAMVPLLSKLRDRGAADRVVYHVWGPDAQERAFAARNNHGKGVAAAGNEAVHAAQRTAISLADANISISGPMTAWLNNEMKARPETVHEIPWLADGAAFDRIKQHRDAVRRELELSHSFVLGYSGSMLSWQLDPEALRKILAACRIREGKVTFLGLTMHGAAMLRALADAGLPTSDVRVLSVPFADMPKYLAAMDLGILGRNLFQAPEFVNRVSSPVKFGEYLLSGVPVILSGALEDFAALTRTHRVGIVVDEDTPVETVAADFGSLMTGDEKTRDALRRRCIDTGNRHLTFQSRMPSYAAALGVDVPQTSTGRI